MTKKMFRKIKILTLSAIMIFSSIYPAFASQIAETKSQSESEQAAINETAGNSNGKGILDISIIYEDDDMFSEGDSYTISYEYEGKKATFDVAETSDNEGSMDIEFEPGTYKITGISYNGSNENVNDFATPASFTIEENKTASAMILVGSDLIDYYLAENADPLFIPSLQNQTQASETETESESISSTNNQRESQIDTVKESEEETEAKLITPERKSFWDYPFTQLIPLAIIFGIVFVVVFVLHKKGKF